MTPPDENPDIDITPVVAADLVRLVWRKTRRRKLYRLVRDAANEIHYSLGLLLGNKASDGLAVESFDTGASAASFKAWVRKCPVGLIVLTEQARLKGVVDPVWRTNLSLALARLEDDPEFIDYLRRYEAEFAAWKNDGEGAGDEESCPFSRAVKGKAAMIVKRVAAAILGAAEFRQLAIETMLAKLLAKSPFHTGAPVARLRDSIPIERLVNRATLERLKREFAKADVDWENEDEMMIDAKLSVLTERVLAAHTKAIIAEGYDWDEVVTAAMELAMG